MSFESALFLRAVNDLVATHKRWIAKVARTSRIKDEKEKKVEHDVNLEEYS